MPLLLSEANFFAIPLPIRRLQPPLPIPNISSEMLKLRLEICLISACGLASPSSLRKPQWFAVGWIDPNDKFCTKVDSSGSLNPLWKIRFSVPVDAATSNLETLSLSIEVYRREPVFLGEKLEGAATVMLKEYLIRFTRNETLIEETASFPLTRRSSGKPNGFVDISIRVSRLGFRKGSLNEISLSIEDARTASYQAQFKGIWQRTTVKQAESSKESPRSGTPPPPPPSSNTGFLPSPFLGATANLLPDTYVGLSAAKPSYDKGPGSRNVPDLAAGALAAGAMIVGDDFLPTSSYHPPL